MQQSQYELNPLRRIRLLAFFLILLIVSPAFASPDRIFSDNNRSVGIVTALDAAGNPIRQGTGFILRRDGVIVTNYHLVETIGNYWGHNTYIFVRVSKKRI